MKKIILLSILFLLFTSQSFAFTYGLVDDWSNLNNPNGPWSYNAGSNPLPSNVADWPQSAFGSSQSAWATDNAGHVTPGWFKSIATPDSETYDWLEGDVVVHSSDVSGGNQGTANITWTNPFSGIYDISGGLWLGREVERSNDWNLYLDNVLLDTGNLFTGDIYSRSNPNSFNFQMKGTGYREGTWQISA